MSGPHSETVDPYDYLKIILNSNGTLTRLRQDPHTSPSPDPTLPVLSQDHLINQSNNTSVRIFLPREALNHTSSSKLPLIVYFHGGGFILFSAATSYVHEFCFNLANDVASIVVSVEYRLAPEHRLPAAYDDAVEALHWIITNSNDWLTNYADYSNCYLMGSSAGANIAYNAGLRAAADFNHHNNNNLLLNIRGMILVQPFFGGTKRVDSEIRLFNDPVLPPHVSELMWELSLPVGVDRDHEYCNPTAGNGLDRVRELGWRVLVTGCHGDALVDRQIELAALMEEKGLQVLRRFVQGDCHGIEFRDLIKQKQLLNLIKHFIASY